MPTDEEQQQEATDEEQQQQAADEELSPEDIARTRALRDWLSFDDLQAMGVVSNWQTLADWQEKYGFPSGRLFGPNTRRWNRQHEIEPWLQSRPTATPPLKARQIAVSMAKARRAVKPRAKHPVA